MVSRPPCRHRGHRGHHGQLRAARTPEAEGRNGRCAVAGPCMHTCRCQAVFALLWAPPGHVRARPCQSTAHENSLGLVPDRHRHLHSNVLENAAHRYRSQHIGPATRGRCRTCLEQLQSNGMPISYADTCRGPWPESAMGIVVVGPWALVGAFRWHRYGCECGSLRHGTNLPPIRRAGCLSTLSEPLAQPCHCMSSTPKATPSV